MLLEDGKMLQLTLDESFREKGTSDKIYIDTAHFPQMLYSIRKGDRIYLGDCLICLVVKEVGMDYVNCLIDEGGKSELP